MQITDLRLAMDEAQAAVVAYKAESQAKMKALMAIYDNAGA